MAYDGEPYVSVVELRQQIDKESKKDDTILRFILDAATQMINDVTGHPDGFRAAAASARVMAGSGSAVQWIDECIEVTTVEVKRSPTDSTYTAWSTADWVAATGEPRTPNFNRLPHRFLMALPTGSYSFFTSGSAIMREGFSPLHITDSKFAIPTVRVTARWGYSEEPPQPIKQATLICASRWFKRGQGVWADTLANQEMGQLMFMKQLDPDAALILERGKYLAPMLARR